MWVVMRGRERVDDIFFLYLLQYVFFKRDQKGGVYVGVVMGKN